MKYVILSLQSMKVKLFIMIFVLVVSFFLLLTFYGETVRNHHFILSTINFTASKAGGDVMTSEQWDAICAMFDEYKEKVEGDAYVSITLFPEGEDIYSSLYYFQGEENSFTRKEYKSCAKIIKTRSEKEKIHIGSTELLVQPWDSFYSEIPTTTVASEQLPIWKISIVCGCMSGKDYKSLSVKLKNILSGYSCTVEQIDQVIKMEQQKTGLFLVVVLVSVFNIALIYQYIMQEQRYHIIIYRLCGSKNYQLYLISLVEIMILFIVSFVVAAVGYHLLYPAMFRLGIVSLKNAMGFAYIVTACILCGMITILFLLVCSVGIIQKPVKELYVEGV